jgi:putative tryptophan/tyrosine transport system substrate-binding protein
MKRREFIMLLGGAAAGWRIAARAQQPSKLPLVGVLVSASPPHPFADAFGRGLQNLGYSEGRTIAIEFRYSGGNSERAREIATEFVRLGIDVFVAHFTPAVRAAMGATQSIPIVMAPAGAPLQSGFIDSLAHPGGNVTGLSSMDAEIGGKRLQLLGDLIPSLARVAVLSSDTATDPFSGPYVENIRLAATRAGLRHKVHPRGPSATQKRARYPPLAGFRAWRSRGRAIEPPPEPRAQTARHRESRH